MGDVEEEDEEALDGEEEGEGEEDLDEAEGEEGEERKMGKAKKKRRAMTKSLNPFLVISYYTKYTTSSKIRSTACARPIPSDSSRRIRIHRQQRWCLLIPPLKKNKKPSFECELSPNAAGKRHILREEFSHDLNLYQ